MPEHDSLLQMENERNSPCQTQKHFEQVLRDLQLACEEQGHHCPEGISAAGTVATGASLL